MDLQEMGWGDTYWIYVSHDWDRWQALVNAVIKLQGL
jgi:hypothetical protein